MAIIPSALAGPLALGTTLAAIYTAPAGTSAVVKRAVFTNVSASTAAFTVQVARSGGAGFAIILNQFLAPGATYPAPELENLVLSSGDVIKASASALASVNAIASGFTLT